MIEQLKSFLSITPEELKQPVLLKRKDDVFYLLLNTKANAFNKDFIRAIQLKIDQVEKHDGPTAMITVSLSKMFSGGLDLRYVSHLHAEDRRYFVLEFNALIGRISVLPFPTLCLVRGGAVAGGCMLSFAHDFVYVGGKGMFSTNQSQNGMYFPPGMMAVIKKRHCLPSSMRDMMILSIQFSAEKALQAKMIDGIWTQEQAVKNAHILASEHSQFGENKIIMKRIKSELYKDVIDACFNQQHATGRVGECKMTQFPKL